MGFTYVLRLSGTLPPVSASFVMTCLCSQTFHFRRAIEGAGVAEFLRQLFSRAKAAFAAARGLCK